MIRHHCKDSMAKELLQQKYFTFPQLNETPNHSPHSLHTGWKSIRPLTNQKGKSVSPNFPLNHQQHLVSIVSRYNRVLLIKS